MLKHDHWCRKITRQIAKDCGDRTDPPRRCDDSHHPDSARHSLRRFAAHGNLGEDRRYSQTVTLRSSGPAEPLLRSARRRRLNGRCLSGERSERRERPSDSEGWESSPRRCWGRVTLFPIGIAPILRKLEGFGSAEISEGVEKTANLPPPLRVRPDRTRSQAPTPPWISRQHTAQSNGTVLINRWYTTAPGHSSVVRRTIP